ncbi:hypothetical protein PG985_011522 [Apiospora marii]|uniref:uncharacterized protein n=1 Tax=Apiospora marii TaxID=335849 RepID=UPI0031309291
MAADPTDAEYTLYSAPFSLYSMMARHTVLLGPKTLNAKPPKKIDLHFINHKKNENLGENYLLNINPKGQIPAMTGGALEKPLTDSMSITLHLAETHYPAMLPADHEVMIREILGEMHAIPGLSFSRVIETPEMNPSPAEKMLERQDISPAYRQALLQKLMFHYEGNALAFQPGPVAKARRDLKILFGKITVQRLASGAYGKYGPPEWTFGWRVGPTALDAHLLPLVLRCVEVGHDDLPTQDLKTWANAMARSPAWQKTMHGGPTVWDPSMGPVEEMQKFMDW